MKRSDEILNQATREARRIAYEREDYNADLVLIACGLMHRAMMEELRPYIDAKVRAMSLVLPTGYAVREDGSLEPLPLEIPPELRPGLDALDEFIRGIQAVYSEAAQALTYPPTPPAACPH